MRNHLNDNRSLTDVLKALEQENMMMNGRSYVLLMGALTIWAGLYWLAIGWALALLIAWGSGFAVSKASKSLFLLALMLWVACFSIATMFAVV